MASKNPRIPHPKSWPIHVRAAILHVIALAQFATAYMRSWSVNSINSRIRLKAELDRANQELTRRILVPMRREKFLRELVCYQEWFNNERPHTTLGGRTPNEVYFQRRPDDQRPCIEPRRNWLRQAVGACGWQTRRRVYDSRELSKTAPASADRYVEARGVKDEPFVTSRSAFAPTASIPANNQVFKDVFARRRPLTPFLVRQRGHPTQIRLN